MHSATTMPQLAAGLFSDHHLSDESYAEVVELLHDNARFVVVAHEGPDGDAIGSTLAMCHLLWALGKDAVPFNVDPINENFRFLAGSANWRTSLGDDATFDVTVVLDCCERNRVGRSFPENGWGEQILVLDHHQTWDPNFATLCLRDTGAAAVGEMVYRLALAVGSAIDKPFAECCYASLMTDTGSFRYSNTSSTTFDIASQLIAAGVDPWHMTTNIYENDPVERLELLAKVLSTLRVSDCGRLAFLRVDRADLEATGRTPDVIDGFINYARAVKGVEVATQLREVDDQVFKVSFRSRGWVNVGELAETFGGGGHKNAAGCVVEGDANEIQERLTQQLDAMLARGGEQQHL